MTSRWMLQVSMRNRAHRRRLGNLSLTRTEEKFYRPKMNESMDTHIERMRTEAWEELIRPKEWYRHLARVLQVIDGPLDANEWRLIKNGEHNGYTVAETEASILRYRRITQRDPKPDHKIKVNIGRPEEPSKPKHPKKPKQTGFIFVRPGKEPEQQQQQTQTQTPVATRSFTFIKG